MGCSLSLVNLLILIGLLPFFLHATGGDSSNKQYGKMPLTEHDVTRGTEIAKRERGRSTSHGHERKGSRERTVRERRSRSRQRSSSNEPFGSGSRNQSSDRFIIPGKSSSRGRSKTPEKIQSRHRSKSREGRAVRRNEESSQRSRGRSSSRTRSKSHERIHTNRRSKSRESGSSGSSSRHDASKLEAVAEKNNKRIDRLVEKVGQIGKISETNLLKYEEYRQMEISNHPQLHIFRIQKQALDQHEKELSKAFPSLNHHCELAELRQILKQGDKVMAIACKREIIKLFKEGGPCGYLNLFDFLRHPEYINIKNVYTMSKFQSEELDNLANDKMIEDHFVNRQKMLEHDSHMQRALVEGGGPVGLLAAFHLFIAGMNVTVVNDRNEYTRNQLLDIPPKLLVQYRYFLGTKFDEVFSFKQPDGKIDDDIGGHLTMRELEEAMSSSMIKLSNLIQKQYGEKSIQLLNGVKMDGIGFGMGGINVHYGKISNAMTGQQMPPIPMDLLVCAGGANDGIRDKYLGKPEKLSNSKYYGRTIFWKKDRKKIFNFVNPARRINISKMKDYLNKQRIAQMTRKNSKILKMFGREYFETLVDRILEGVRENCDQKGRSIDPKEILIYTVEDDKTLTIVAETPTALYKMLTTIKRQKNNYKRNSTEYNALEEFHQRIQRKWFTALTEYVYWYQSGEKADLPININIDPFGDRGPDAHGVMNFDPYPVNTSIFEYTLNALSKPTNFIYKDGHTLLMTAMGDANITPNFLSGIGVNSGRIQIDLFIGTLNEYTREKRIETEEFIENANNNSKFAQELVINEAKYHVFLKPGVNSKSIKRIGQLLHSTLKI